MATECGRAAAEVAYHLVTHAVHGYTQGAGRDGTGWETIDYKGLTIGFPGGDGDCSSIAKRVWDAVGRVVGHDMTGYATYTGNMAAGLLSTGLWTQKPMSWRANVCPGDLYLTYTRGHVAIAYDHDHLCEFNRNELHAATGGRPGDQDGLESVYRAYYNYPWDCIMHYSGPDYLAEKLEEDEMPTPQDLWNYDGNGAKLTNISNKIDSVLALVAKPSVVVEFGGDFHRLNNTTTGAHTYTNDEATVKSLLSAGWRDEGVLFALSTSGDTPVYMMVNQMGDTLFTTNINEARNAANSGWATCGAIGFSGSGHEVYRLLNPKAGLHLFTKDANERRVLLGDGWTDEGVAFRSA